MDPTLAERYPRLAAYVAGLPAGLDSHPECLAKASLCRALLDGMPAPLPAPSDLPDPAARLVAHPPAAMWMPEVQVMALALTIADQYRMSDGEYLGWLKQRNRSLFRTLMYRALFAFLSPASLAPKAAARWAAVHRGSELTCELVAPGLAELRLTFPPRLFAPLLLQSFTAVFQAAIEHSNARTCEVSLTEIADTTGLYVARWT